MQSKLFVAILASGMAVSGMAYAEAASMVPHNTVGTVETYSPDMNTLTLKDGDSFQLPSGEAFPVIRPDDMVTLTWLQDGNARRVIDLHTYPR